MNLAECEKLQCAAIEWNLLSAINKIVVCPQRMHVIEAKIRFSQHFVFISEFCDTTIIAHSHVDAPDDLASSRWRKRAKIDSDDWMKINDRPTEKKICEVENISLVRIAKKQERLAFGSHPSERA